MKLSDKIISYDNGGLKLSDRIISAAIKYQIACSRAQGIGAPIEIPQDELDYVTKQAFNELCSAALMADELADLIAQHETNGWHNLSVADRDTLIRDAMK